MAENTRQAIITDFGNKYLALTVILVMYQYFAIKTCQLFIYISV